jgi:hypothetical protein
MIQKSAGGRPVTIGVAESSGREVAIESSRIVQMDMTSTKFFQRFNGRHKYWNHLL